MRRNTKTKFLNRMLLFLNRGEYKKFTRPCNIRKVQFSYLHRLLQKNADTLYGRKYGFSDIKSYRDFAQKVPFTVYEDYEPYIDAIKNGKKAVLTREDVRLFELTSGSSGGKKLIPYTKSLKREFERGIKPWLYDIYSRLDGVDEGQSYWSITPVTSRKSRTPCGIPVGFEEDTEYFGFLGRKLMEHLFAVNASVKFAGSMDDFYMRTCRELLLCPCLTLISVWNPTFLTLLCDFMKEHKKALLAELKGEKKAVFLREVEKGRFDRIFPDLKIISCWADASAASYVDDVRRYFPGVYIQAKGLLATECFVSFPRCGEDGSRLSIYSHFFEFRSLKDGQTVTADRLKKGDYELVVTTGGGFYRYLIGDIIRVLKTYPDAPPNIRFIERKGICSDLFGEKLTEEFVANVFQKLNLTNGFHLLAPEGERYCLYTGGAGISAEKLDAALCESYHYNYCRRLNQLKMAKVVKLAGHPEKAYIERLSMDGMRVGDIKPACLSKKDGWGKYFHCVTKERNT